MLTVTLKKTPQDIYKVKFKIAKTINDDIMIYDHPNINIVISPSKAKILAFPKEMLDEEVSDTQDRFFSFLKRNGCVVIGSVQGGNAFGVVEASYPKESSWTEPLHYILYNISKFFEQDIPEQKFVDKILQKNKDDMTDPTVDSSTELGEIPHDANKGVTTPMYNTWGNMVPYRAF